MREAELYKTEKNSNVKCLARGHYCLIPDGKTGICGVRKNSNGKLYLEVYGHPSAINIDPVEKKPLYHFLPGTEIFSFGTLGCNFKCEFCQNWELSQSPKNNSKLPVRNAEKSEKKTWPPEKIIKFCLDKKIPSIAFTYNEPTVFFEYAFDTAAMARKYGIKNVLVTNGYFSSEAGKKWIGTLDAANIDLKSISDKFYKNRCGTSLEPVLNNIEFFFKKNIWIELTTLLIPGENDSPEEIKKIAEFIKSISKNIPWHISRFHPDYKMADKQATNYESLKMAHEIGVSSGLNHVYLGNVADKQKSNTYCTNCHELLINRVWNSAEIISLSRGKCNFCGNPAEGIWK
jgi:pyruvate formate lyase activating enzyme